MPNGLLGEKVSLLETYLQGADAPGTYRPPVAKGVLSQSRASVLPDGLNAQSRPIPSLPAQRGEDERGVKGQEDGAAQGGQRLASLYLRPAWGCCHGGEVGTLVPLGVVWLPFGLEGPCAASGQQPGKERKGLPCLRGTVRFSWRGSPQEGFLPAGCQGLTGRLPPPASFTQGLGGGLPGAGSLFITSQFLSGKHSPSALFSRDSPAEPATDPGSHRRGETAPLSLLQTLTARGQDGELLHSGESKASDPGSLL